MADDGTASELDDLDVAVAHWHVNAWGGAEYLATALAEELGADCIYTTGSPSPDDPNPYGNVPFYDVTQDLSLTPLRRLQTRVNRVFEYALWEDVDWTRYGPPDVLVTSGATTRAVITPDTMLHINYCHSPPRWFYDRYHDRKGTALGLLARPLLRHLRTRDVTVDSRVDDYLANSPVIKRRLWKYYDRESEVLYPPVALDDYYDDGDEGFYLHLGRIDSEKGVEAIVTAFAELESDIVFAGGEGDAPSWVTEEIQAQPNMRYDGFVSEERKLELLATCRAVVFNGRNEDFGIVPIEANASGKACLARNDGFPGMFIRDGENGYRHDGTDDSIRAAVSQFESEGLDADPSRFVSRFARSEFADQLQSHVVQRQRTFEQNHLQLDA
jgi:glycosyltransferase involved in cell wall biosynthesis